MRHPGAVPPLNSDHAPGHARSAKCSHTTDNRAEGLPGSQTVIFFLTGDQR